MDTRPAPPGWVTHFAEGLRHVGSVDEAGNVSLAGLSSLNAARDRWLVENGYERGESP
jgi:hypothetical protein